MNAVPVAFCLMTTTKGHFGVKTRYLETLNSFNKALPFAYYAERMAHIKVSPGEQDIADDMKKELEIRGFKVYLTEGAWSHGTDSHQSEYLKDCLGVVNEINTPYVFMVEDDWQIKTYTLDFIDYIAKAVELLDNNSGLMQVRIPRWNNELERIRGLKAKHNLDRWADNPQKDHFLHNDFSMNPSFYRTRDLRGALLLVQMLNVPKHIEHGLGETLKLLSGLPNAQLACFLPEQIRIGHLGTLQGEEDSLDKPLFST